MGKPRLKAGLLRAERKEASKEVGSLKRHAKLSTVPAHIGKFQRTDIDLYANCFR
jgi:hypothetical protein